MVALGAVACAAVVQAASVNWNFTVSAMDSNYESAVGNVAISALTQNWSSPFDEYGSANFSVSGTTDDIFAAGTEWTITTTAKLTGNDGVTQEDYTFSQVFTMPSLPTDDTSIQSALAGLADNITAALDPGGIGTLPTIEDAIAAGWTAAGGGGGGGGSTIPEPTSGLLLLLGVAGLALKRKLA